jgi:hypothetical protein
LESLKELPWLSKSLIEPKLRSPKRQGHWLMSFCPAHRDGEKNGGRSLGLSLQTNQLKCFAGCKFGDILEGLGIEKGVEEDVPELDESEPVAPDIYYDLYDPRDHSYICTKGRWDKTLKSKKRFAFTKVQTGEEGYTNHHIWEGLNGEPVDELPPWHWEGIGKDPNDWVIVTEGEKACAELTNRGLRSISWVGGSSQRIFGHADVLRGRRVAIWPDNDEPGALYAESLRDAIKPYAKKVVILTVPSWMPAKGDAVEFFAHPEATSFDALLTQSVPLVEGIDDDYLVTIPDFSTSSHVVFSFQNCTYQKMELWTEVTVELSSYESVGYSQRLNALSASARDQIVRSLKQHFDGVPINWTSIINVAVSLLRKEMLDGMTAQSVASLPAVPATFLIDGLIPDGLPTVMFGDGDSGKSWMAMVIGLSIACGRDILGLGQPKMGNVLLVDYEMDSNVVADRVRRLARGLGLKDYSSFFYWDSRGVPLAEQVEQIRRFVRENDIKLVIVDSAGPAVGGPPEDAACTLGYFAAVKSLKVATLTIAHTPKNIANPERPFGSAYWHNMARKTIFVKKSLQDDPDRMKIGLYSKKQSHGRASNKGVGVSLRFEPNGDVKPVRLRNRENATNSEESDD